MGDLPRAALNFTMEVHAPGDLSRDADRADALITVHARSPETTETTEITDAGVDAGAGADSTPLTAEILIMDRSLSMTGLRKIDEARRAVCAAIDTLRDGTLFAVVAGDHEAIVVHPPDGRPVPADETSRREAKAAVHAVRAQGGTRIGSWLECARRLFDTAAVTGVRHAVLYTDGKDEHETRAELDAILDACSDRFICDVRGLGGDWEYRELHRIAQALHGSSVAVIDIADLTADFEALMHEARRVVVPHVYLGLRFSELFTLDKVRQTAPVEADLTGRQQSYEEGLHIPLGAWSPGLRQYQITLRLDPGRVPFDTDLRAAWITLHAEHGVGAGRVGLLPTVPMNVRRRSIPSGASTRSPELTRVGQIRALGMAMRACTDAYEAGDIGRADRELRTALDLADELGQRRKAAELWAVAEKDPRDRVILRRDVTRAEMQRLALDSTRTELPVDSMPVDALDAVGADSTTRCPHCNERLPTRRARFCEACGRNLDTGSGT
ncbi:VWA domain-containing protein [Streptomyces sp. NPDC057694]|uniref:VWA domain-containing protein n=1 Tax=Streptomyces sp. NPDC057694 TaxID=3346216 RepID=UPI0036ADE2ED